MLENIFFEYERIEQNDRKASFNFYFKKSYKFLENTTNLFNCVDNYEYFFQVDSTFYKKVMLHLLNSIELLIQFFHFQLK